VITTNFAGAWVGGCAPTCIYTDPNGNKTTYNLTGTTLTSIVDNLGTTVITKSGTYPNPVSFTYTSPAGSSASVIRSWKPYTIQSAWGCAGYREQSATSTYLTDRVTLPDGTYYQFGYEPSINGQTTGRIASVRLPTGGVITYSYSGVTNGIFCVDGTVPTLTRNTPDGPWKYARTHTLDQYGNVNHSVNTITDPQNNQTVVNFNAAALESERQVYNGGASGTPLEDVITCYNYFTNPPPGIPANPPPSSCTTYTAVGPPLGTAPGSPLTQITKYHSLNGGPYSIADTWLMYNEGLPIEMDAYDFGATTATRKTSIAYASIGSRIIDRPSVVKTTDANGNFISETDYTYDQDLSSLRPSGASQLSPPPSGTPRGNLTTIKSYVTSTTYLTKSFTHYDTGQVYQATDVNGAVTTFTYGTCGNSLLTNTQLPLGLTTSQTWNCSGGRVTTSTDENGKVSYTNYISDPLWRPNSEQDELGHVTSFTYTGATQVESVLSVTGSSSVDKLKTFDALGRPFLDQQRQAPGSTNFDTQTTFFDSDGRPFRSSMPCVTTAGASCASIPSVTTTFDGASRQIQTVDGGGGTR
jgi:hypothetical protein